MLLTDELDTQIRRVLKKKPLFRTPEPPMADLIFLFVVGGLGIVLASTITPLFEPELTIELINSMTSEEQIQKLLELRVEGKGSTRLKIMFLVLLVAVSFLVIGLSPISRFLEKLTRSVFYWGDMIATHDQLETKINRIKWGIGITLIISIIAGIIVNWLSKLN